MKKFLKQLASLFTVFALVLSLLCVPVMSQSITDGECEILDYTNYSNEECALSYLKMLGIVDEIDTSANITRGYAVASIVRALGLEDVALNSGSMYTYQEKMAFTAHKCGILSGNTPAQWDLDSPVTYPQLSKMIVVALGYGAIITSPNPYPNEYLAYSSKLGLTNGVAFSSDEYISGWNFSVILSNALKADLVQIVGIENNEAIYKITNDTTLEDVYLNSKNLIKSTGIVESDFYTSIVQNARCEKNRIRINGNIYACESADLIGFVGNNVEFVYSNESKEANRVVSGIRLTDDNKVYNFSSGHSASIRNGVLYYENQNKKESNINISANAVYVINNTPLSSYNFSSLDFGQYTIKLIDNDNNKQCDVVFLTKSESVIVNYVKDDIVYLSYGTINLRNIIDLTEYDEDTDTLIIRDIDGNVKSLEDIKEDMSISVIASSDLKCIEIILLPGIQSGKFEEYDSTNNTVVVNGVVYGLAKLNNEFVLGNTYNIRVNENNEIFYIETILSDCSYIVDVGNMNQGLLNGVMIKVYDNDNGIQVFPVSEKVIIAGTTYSDDASIVSAIEKGTLAYVTLNSENKVRKIEYLNRYGESAKRLYRSQASGFNDMTLAESLPFRFNEDTVFFYIPKNGNDADFGFSLPLKNKDEYTTAAYEFDEETGFVKAVIIEVDNDMRTDNYITYSSDVGIVTSVRQVVDADGQGVYKVEGFHDGEAFAYTSGHYDDVFSICNTLKPGDVIRYIANYSGEIVRIQKTISLSDNIEFFHDGKDTVDERFYGKVLTLSKNVLTNYSEYLSHEMNVSMTASYNDISFMRFPGVLTNPYDTKYQFSNYYTYNKRTKEVSVATIDDIITCEMAGDSASNVFVQRSKSDVQCIVIVKE